MVEPITDGGTFATSKQSISYHITNILKEKELPKIAVVKNILTTASDGKQYMEEHYSLDADTITKGWKENNWPKPQIREIYDPDRVEMVLSLDALDAKANVGSDTDDDTKSDTNKLSEKQRIIYRMLDMADTNNETNTSVLTSSVIARHLGVSTITGLMESYS